MTTKTYPPLPEPASFAVFAGSAMQGSEIRPLSEAYNPGYAMYTDDHMQAYADAALESRVEAVADKIYSLMTHTGLPHFRDFCLVMARESLGLT